MNDLRKAAEMALERLESHDYWMDEEAIQALRQALTPEVTPEVPCKTHPDAPHGFDRNASHSADRYVCECEGWEPVEEPFIYIREVTEMPFGGYEHCGEHDPGALPVYLAPPQKEWVGLTNEDIDDLWKTEYFNVHYELPRAIEAKLKEKNK